MLSIYYDKPLADFTCLCARRVAIMKTTNLSTRRPLNSCVYAMLSRRRFKMKF